jgi:hypothetical protein
MRPPTSRAPIRGDGDRGAGSGHRERRLTLADLMLLVAATAPGLAVVRFANTLGLYDERIMRTTGKVRLALEAISVFVTPVIVPWTLMVLILSLRKPRPPLRRVAGRPGFVACACVALTLLLQAPDLVIRACLIETFPEVGTQYGRAVATITLFSGVTILGAWMALALAGRWRPGRSWLDRLGCILGCYYIFIYVINKIYFTVQLFR